MTMCETVPMFNLFKIEYFLINFQLYRENNHCKMLMNHCNNTGHNAIYIIAYSLYKILLICPFAVIFSFFVYRSMGPETRTDQFGSLKMEIWMTVQYFLPDKRTHTVVL